MTSRAKTAEEVRAEFVYTVRQLASYWSTTACAGTVRDRLDGLAFSILNIFDGNSGQFPCAIDMALSPHPDDKAYHQADGENWYEPGMVINECQLHELYYQQREEDRP